MYLRKNSALKYFIVGIVGAALYFEWFLYLLQPLFWVKLECIDDSSCVKVLFVADPQIQGDYALPPPLSYVVNADSDKYLKSTFQVVIKHFQPDVIVYLGDLTDEGSISTMEQFHGYVKRLADIFNIPFPVAQIWLPGDNDIGGENEPIKKSKLQEFSKIFHQPDVINFKNISFYKVNGITHKIPKVIEDDNLRIVVSHYPVTVQAYFGQLVNNAIRPQIYFCAHDHESKYVVQSKSLGVRETTPLHCSYDRKILEASFITNTDLVMEVYVPTCSYRMGTSMIGYGAAVFENKGSHMRYTVFWSPQRFPYLILYLIVLIVLTTYFCSFYITKVFLRRLGLNLPVWQHKT